MSNMSLDMHVIALFDSIKVGQTEALLSYEKADLEEIRDADGNSVLHVAALCGHVRIVEKLKFICPELFKVTNPEDRLLNDTKPNLLQISTINDQREICLWLCSEYSRRGLSLDFTDDSGNSLVHIATANGSIRCLQVLISSDVKFQTKNHAGKTPREMAQDNNQPVIIGYLSMAESVAHLKAELLLLTSRIYVNQITQTEEQTQTAAVAIQKSMRSVSPKQVESDGDDLDDELVEIMKQGSQLDSRQSSPTSKQNVTSSMIYAESATSEVPSVEADFCRTYLGDEESIRASVIPASMAGSHYEPTSRQFLYSPTITECANEEQMETKTEMRKKISMLGPKLVSPKRTLGSGPVLIGKLESVPEKSPIKTPQKASSSSSDRPSISASTLTPISTPTSTLPKPAKLRTKNGRLLSKCTGKQFNNLLAISWQCPRSRFPWNT
ncbi:Oidioi.mRNA.OKI2018_I69.PAR.g11895.t1.cds [Oikopleura dioica]|uniref:Oidioi.mRNA.OKI2018_I69.PAR.g11895.t1.cds n=1 Tax=Oikopleura dioica TaxID=34765 RepID=A0ABN7S2M3_OIKDI|nr:Oidioi.mRNA.OKI2018_I69.PAR.g11895.t1.cds [Oikopleura dioica]